VVLTRRVHINQCLESRCQNDGGPRLLCAIHAPSYDPLPVVDAGAKVAGQGAFVEVGSTCPAIAEEGAT